MKGKVDSMNYKSTRVVDLGAGTKHSSSRTHQSCPVPDSMFELPKPELKFGYPRTIN